MGPLDDVQRSRSISIVHFSPSVGIKVTERWKYMGPRRPKRKRNDAGLYEKAEQEQIFFSPGKMKRDMLGALLCPVSNVHELISSPRSRAPCTGTLRTLIQSS